MSQLWLPGAQGPLEELVTRVHRRIEAFRELHGLQDVSVVVELADGAVHELASLSPDPGFGFVTLSPHTEDGDPFELIVPLGSIREIRLGRVEPDVQMGFTVGPSG